MDSDLDIKEFIKSSQKTIILLVTTVILGIAAFFLGSSAFMAYQDAEIVQSKIKSMVSEINTWNDKANLLNEQEFRPVTQKEVQGIQANILNSLKNHNLTLVGLKNNTAEDGRLLNFDLEFSGTYDNIIPFLTSFGSNDALISMYQLKFSAAENNIIKMNLSYVIYLKN